MRSNATQSDAIPLEFEDLLSRAGRQVLAGSHSLCGALANPRTRFLARDDLLDRAKVGRLRRALEAELGGTLEPLERPRVLALDVAENNSDSIRRVNAVLEMDLGKKFFRMEAVNDLNLLSKYLKEQKALVEAFANAFWAFGGAAAALRAARSTLRTPLSPAQLTA